MTRALRSSAVFLFAALALSACQTGRTPPPEVTAPPAPAPVAIAPEPAPAPVPQVAARPPEPVVNDDPNQFMGLDRSALTALLGTPDLIRREDPAEIWQYVTTDCVVDVVLYNRGQRYAVSYLEARDVTAARQAPQPCLNRLLRDKMAAPVS